MAAPWSKETEHTQVEVVLEAVAKSHQAEDQMPHGCKVVSMLLASDLLTAIHFQ